MGSVFFISKKTVNGHRNNLFQKQELVMLRNLYCMA
ncbi:MAG: hypothetical protein GQ574_24850 [Crocinitomix sp.]|nr:hypothetical protein [Crocinitomix sp.]